jgi:phosphoribosylformylglycinamidine cyclo-ligase
MAEITYKDAGVDLELYEQSMAKLPRLMKRTHTPRVMPLIGGFAGLFRLDYNSRLFAKNYRDPILVSGTDGVGTKIKVAVAAGKYDTIGIDLVGMCVNDCLCMGAEPLFFLDYLAMGKDDPELVSQLVTGISDGCVRSDMALIGGETAIMPDVYQPGDFDLAGFSVGVVERKKLVDGTKTIRKGDVIIGMAASGFHSNGYSLVRKVVTDVAGLKYDDYAPELETTVAEALLEPTRLYVRSVVDLLTHYRARSVIRGMAHITGGGLPDNITRVLPENCRVKIDTKSWERPALFQWIQGLGNIAEQEMYRVFNMGIGYVLVVNPYFADSIMRRIAEHRISSCIIGEVVEGEKGVDLI